MGEAYPYMDLNAKYGKKNTTMFTAIETNKDISKTRQVHVKQNVGQREDFMHSNFQMEISLPWIDAAFTLHLKRLPKYIYLLPPLIFPTTSTELEQKTARCESLRALLHYVEWDRIVTLTGAQADWGLRYRIY